MRKKISPRSSRLHSSRESERRLCWSAAGVNAGPLRRPGPYAWAGPLRELGSVTRLAGPPATHDGESHRDTELPRQLKLEASRAGRSSAAHGATFRVTGGSAATRRPRPTALDKKSQ
jgi:hypothetical protein